MALYEVREIPEEKPEGCGEIILKIFIIIVVFLGLCIYLICKNYSESDQPKTVQIESKTEDNDTMINNDASTTLALPIRQIDSKQSKKDSFSLPEEVVEVNNDNNIDVVDKIDNNTNDNCIEEVSAKDIRKIERQAKREARKDKRNSKQ